MDNNQGKLNKDRRSNSGAGPILYEIKVQGHLDQVWSKWFEGMTLTHTQNCESGVACTLITGLVIDQPALHGLLTKIRDLNLTLVSVRRITPGGNKEDEETINPGLPGEQDRQSNTS